MGISNQIPNSRIAQAGVVGSTAERPASKICSKCGVDKDINDYYDKPGGKYGLTARCKPCHTEATKNWAKRNPDAVNRIAKKQREIHKDRIAQRWANYYALNKTHIAQKKRVYRAKTAEQRAEYQKQWYKNNPGKPSEYAHRRRVRELSGDIRVFKDSDWDFLLRQYNNRCAYCGGDGTLTKDHVIPVSRGGRHAVGNIVPACETCNFSKHNRLLVEWKKVVSWG